MNKLLLAFVLLLLTSPDVFAEVRAYSVMSFVGERSLEYSFSEPDFQESPGFVLSFEEMSEVELGKIADLALSEAKRIVREEFGDDLPAPFLGELSFVRVAPGVDVWAIVASVDVFYLKGARPDRVRIPFLRDGTIGHLRWLKKSGK
jgi:hypothetical protein